MASGSGGNIRKRSNGTWEGRYRQDGRQRSVYAKTYAEAQGKLREALRRVDNNIQPGDGRTSVSAYLDEWLEASGNRLRPKTLASYSLVARLYLKPHIGRIPLAKLTKQDVNRMLNKVAVGRSPTTVRYARTVLRSALQVAVEEERLPRNVAKLSKVPEGKAKRFTPLTISQARQFQDSVDSDRLAPLYKTALNLGLRQGELLGLRWQDVDLDAATLKVKNALQRIDGKLELVPPKTEESQRTLDLPAIVVKALREHRVRQLEERLAAGRRWQDGGFVFTTSIGTPLDGTNVTHAFQAALRTAGLPHQRFHDLRHACATMLIEDGEDLAVVSKLLGHSNYTTTVNTYTHLTRDMGRRAARRMDSIMGEPRQAASS